MCKEERRDKEIDLLSEEVQEIMSEIPSWILRYGITILFIIILVLLVGSWFYKYPDIIKVNITLTSTNPPASIISQSTGNIDTLFVKDNENVKAQTPLAVIQNSAKTEDVQKLIYLMREWCKNGYSIDMVEKFIYGRPLSLGDIQPFYANFINSLYDYHLSLKKFSPQKIVKSQLSVKNASEALLAHINAWKQSYLVVSQIDGVVNQVGIWRNNQTVKVGETIFTVTPLHQKTPVGKALLPVYGSGKVKIGQRANVRINNFPYQEFGYLRGKVTSISSVPSTAGFYVVEMEFPNGIVTNYGRTLPVTQQMVGTADIITDDLRLLERLFMPIKNLFNN